MSRKKSGKKADYSRIEAQKEIKRNNIRKKKTAIISSVIAACIFAVIAVAAVSIMSKTDVTELTSVTWTPNSATNSSGDEVEMSEVYNTNYLSFKGSLSFDENGKFSLWLSPGNPDDGTHNGKYTISESDKVTLTFNDGTKTNLSVSRKNGKINYLKLKYNNYDIMFTKG